MSNDVTVFDQVSELMSLSGLPKPPLSNPNWTNIARLVTLLDAKAAEAQMHQAIKDSQHFRDDIANLILMLYQLGYEAGYPMDADLFELISSTTTMLDTNLPDAQRTEAQYTAMGIQSVMLATQPSGTGSWYYAVKSAKDQTAKDGTFYPVGTLLPSVNYLPQAYCQQDIVDRFLAVLKPVLPLTTPGTGTSNRIQLLKPIPQFEQVTINVNLIYKGVYEIDFGLSVNYLGNFQSSIDKAQAIYSLLVSTLTGRFVYKFLIASIQFHDGSLYTYQDLDGGMDPTKGLTWRRIARDGVVRQAVSLS